MRTGAEDLERGGWRVRGLRPRHDGRRDGGEGGRLHHPVGVLHAPLGPRRQGRFHSAPVTPESVPPLPPRPLPGAGSPPRFVPPGWGAPRLASPGGGGADSTLPLRGPEGRLGWAGTSGWGGAGLCREGAPRASPGVGPPARRRARRGVGGDVTARPRPPLAPAPALRRPRRLSLSPRDTPAGGGGPGAARSQPARRERRGAGRAGGAQPSRGAAVTAPAQPAVAAAPRTGTRALAGAHVGPPPVTPGGKAVAGTRRRAPQPHLHRPCPGGQLAVRARVLFSARSAPAARRLPFPRPSPVPAENNGANSGVSALHSQSGAALGKGPRAAAPAAAGRPAGSGGGRCGGRERPGGPSLPPALPPPLEGATSQGRGRAASAQAGEGKDGAMGERMQTALRGGTRCSGRAAAWVPGVGRAGAGAASKTGGRAGGGWAARPSRPLRAHLRRCRLAPPGCAVFPGDPSPFPERPAAWEGQPADHACVCAASAPVTGAAWPRARRGRGAAASGLAGLPRRADRVTARSAAAGTLERPAPLSCLSPTSLHAHGTVLALGTGRARGRVPGEWGGSQTARRWVGGGWRAGGAGEGKEGMPSHGDCRARARRRPGADPMRAHVPRNADFPPETHGPLLKRPPPSRGVRIAGLEDLLGPADWPLRLRRGAGAPHRNPGNWARPRAQALVGPSRPPTSALRPSWPVGPARAAVPILRGLSAQLRLWTKRRGPAGAGAVPAAAILQVWLVTRLSRPWDGEIGCAAGEAPALGLSVRSAG